MASNYARGFTLIEAMVAIAVLAILMAIAVPSFQGAALGSQLRSLSSDLLSSAALARSEAIKRNAPVRVCASASGTACGSDAWESGWIVESGGTVILRRDAAPTGFTITPTGGNAAIVFQPTGVGATPEEFTLCRATPNPGHQERIVTIDAAGRASSRRTTTGSCS